MSSINLKFKNMVRILNSQLEIDFCCDIEKSMINLQGKFPGKFNQKKFSNIIFLPDTFILRHETFDLLNVNFDFQKSSFLARHFEKSVTYFEFIGLEKVKWLSVFEGKFENNTINADFAYFIYSEFVCLFDWRMSWLYYHQKDYPNVLLSDINLNIPKKLAPYLLSEKDVFEEIGNYLDERERTQLRLLFENNIVVTNKLLE